jgi:hypothetical protein
MLKESAIFIGQIFSDISIVSRVNLKYRYVGEIQRIQGVLLHQAIILEFLNN